MICLPYQTSETAFNVFLVLEKTNIDRMRLHDPAVLTISKMGAPWTSLRLDDISIVYANPDELEHFAELVKAGKPRDAMKFLARGWRFRPEDGDADGDYRSIKG